MLPGNIDLTENLDFRPVRKPRPNPQVPWSTKNQKSNIGKYPTNYTYTTISITSSHTNFNYDSDNAINWFTGYNMHIVNNDYELDNDIYSYTCNNITWTSQPPENNKIPWSTNQIWSDSVNVIKKLPWNSIFCDNYRNHRNAPPHIPWFVRPNTPWHQAPIPWDSIMDAQQHESDDGRDVRSTIPWLTYMNAYHLSAHMNELRGIDESRYLTDMMHLRIHDVDNNALNNAVT